MQLISRHSLALESRKDKPLVTPELYHLSFDGDLEGIWKPKLPDGSGVKGESKYPEPDYKRISVSTSIQGALQAIYPNVYRYFEEENYPYMDFYIYQPILKGQELYSSEVLTNMRYVHDAHITGEYHILEKVKMELVGKVRLQNTNDIENLTYYPFEDVSLPKESVGPDLSKAIIDIKMDK